MKKKPQSIGEQLESLSEQLGSIFQTPPPAKPEPVGLSPAIFTQDGWTAWAGQDAMPAWLQALSHYPHWLVQGCAAVLAVAALWLFFRMLRWTLMLLVPLVLVAVAAWATWFFFLSDKLAEK